MKSRRLVGNINAQFAIWFHLQTPCPGPSGNSEKWAAVPPALGQHLFSSLLSPIPAPHGQPMGDCGLTIMRLLLIIVLLDGGAGLNVI